MRLLALFFSLYFAVLACLPCTDKAVACADAAQTPAAAAAHSDCSQGSLGDWCSPLCQCRCCAGATLLAAVVRVPERAATTQPDAVRAFFRVVAPTRGATAVWQPPRA